MTERKDIKSVERRDFMRKTGFGLGALGAAAVATPKGARGGGDGPSDEGKAGYRETEHVKRYYATARS